MTAPLGEPDSPLLTAAWDPFRYHAVQQALWRCKARLVAVAAGRGSGKTELLKRKLVLALREQKPWPTPRYFYAAPTTAQAKRIAWQSFVNLIPKNWLRRRPMVSELKFETVFGSELQIFGMDKPMRIEGEQWDGGGIDESCDQKPKSFDLSVFPALIHRDGWCWRIGVPKRQGVGAAEFRKFYEDAACGKLPDAAGFAWPSRDIVTPEKLAHARATMDLYDYLEQFEAQFQSAGGGIFHSFDLEENVRKVEYDSKRMIVVASDFNHDPMAWALGHAHKERMDWFGELFLRHTNTAHALDVLWARYSSHAGGFHFFGDATGKQDKSSASESDYTQILNDPRFKAAGRDVSYPKANPAVADRFASCNAMFCNAIGQRRMYVDPCCEHLIEDLQSRYYKPDTNAPADPKGSMMGHMTDAMGYAVFALFPVSLDGSGDAYEVTIDTV